MFAALESSVPVVLDLVKGILHIVDIGSMSRDLPVQLVMELWSKESDGWIGG